MIDIIGSGGHAGAISGVLDALHLPWRMVEEPAGLVVIGVGDIDVRRSLFDRYDAWFPIIDPTAIVRGDIGKAVQIMAGAVIQPNALIGDNTLVNTGARIDHDCIVGQHCHIAPGAVLCGGVRIGDGSFIGAGSIIVQGVKIPPGSFVPAGALVAGDGDVRKR